jgi:DNA-binding NtrC family response regulator
MSIEDQLRVSPDALRFRFNGHQFPWNSTQEQPPCTTIIGQERALRAIRLGLEMKSIGYNVFVTGLSGTGKMTTIQSLLAEIDRSSRTTCATSTTSATPILRAASTCRPATASCWRRR